MGAEATKEKQVDCFKPEKLLKYANENRNKGYFNDVILQSENKCFSANRMVLSCYSIVFEKMFQTEMKEKYEKTVEIESIKPDVLELIINYIYTGNLGLSDSNAYDLVAAAHFLQMEELTEHCFTYLELSISYTNCFTFLTAAILYEKASLSTKIYKYISENFSNIVQSNDFLCLTSHNLITCISDIDKAKVKEEDIFYAIVKWTYHDEENRKKDFSVLFQYLDFHKLSWIFLEDVVVKEPLVENDSKSLNLVLNACFELRKQEKQEDKKVLPQISEEISNPCFDKQSAITGVIFESSSMSSNQENAVTESQGSRYSKSSQQLGISETSELPMPLINLLSTSTSDLNIQEPLHNEEQEQYTPPEFYHPTHRFHFRPGFEHPRHMRSGYIGHRGEHPRHMRPGWISHRGEHPRHMQPGYISHRGCHLKMSKRRPSRSHRY